LQKFALLSWLPVDWVYILALNGSLGIRENPNNFPPKSFRGDYDFLLESASCHQLFLA